MKIITFAATKGGTGKTTLCFNVAMYAASLGHSVYICDLDPQRSLEELCERRDERQGENNNPMVLTGVKSIVTDVPKLIKNGYARDFIFIDTPGSHMTIIEDAIGPADCIVLPVQPSPLDILAQEEVARSVDRLGKARNTLFVLNRVDGRSSVDDTIERIKPLFPHMPVQVNQRLDYSRSLIAGLTGPEINKACVVEISALWAAIEKVIINEESKHDGSGKVIPLRQSAAG